MIPQKTGTSKIKYFVSLFYKDSLKIRFNTCKSKKIVHTLNKINYAGNVTSKKVFNNIT